MSGRSLHDYLATPTLTDLERDALYRRFVLGESVARIAYDLDVTERLVHQRIANARRKIAKHHDDQEHNA